MAKAKTSPRRSKPAAEATDHTAASSKAARRNTVSVVHGDCLEVLPTLLEQGHGAFDLIYADPPFNAGGTRRARLKLGDRSQGTRVYRDHWGGIDGFLEMIEPRIRVMHDALTRRGSLWLHLDQRTVHDVKVLCDRIFARGTFQGEIIWVPGNGSRSKHGPPMTHQTLLVYSRGSQMIWNHEDSWLREAYAETSLRMHFTRQDETGRHFRDRTIAGKTYRYYADAGRRLGSVWSDCPAMSANTPLTRETTGYPTQKPLKLLERIVRAASLPGSRVLDPMCGSGTTIVAAAKHGRIAIGIDLSPVACRIAKQRIADL
jgi:site-specific DNA-methyltransferase (adenine-specific)